MNKYTLFWLDGKSEVVEGNTIEAAFTLAGYVAGAIRALDFHAVGDLRDEYYWDKDMRGWRSVPNVGYSTDEALPSLDLLD